MIKVALFDDSREQRDALRALLNAMNEVTCAGAFPSARQVIGDVEGCTPDVVLTVIEDDDRIFAAIRAGADGYFLKQTPPLKLIDGIVEAMAGGAPMTPSIA